MKLGNGVAQSIDGFPSDEPIEDGLASVQDAAGGGPDRLPGDGRRCRVQRGELIGRRSRSAGAERLSLPPDVVARR